MSMQNYANAGWVIPVSEIFTELDSKTVERLTPFIEEHDSTEVEAILDECWPKDYPKFNTVFVMGEEDESEDLTVGEMYIEFAEDELYEKQPTREMKILTAKGIVPVDSKWVTFG